MLNYLLVKMLSIVEIIMVFNEEFNIVEIYYKIKILLVGNLIFLVIYK